MKRRLALLSVLLLGATVPASPLTAREARMAEHAAYEWAARRWPGEDVLTTNCWPMPRVEPGFAHCYVRVRSGKDETLDCILLLAERHPHGFCESQDD